MVSEGYMIALPHWGKNWSKVQQSSFRLCLQNVISIHSGDSVNGTCSYAQQYTTLARTVVDKLNFGVLTELFSPRSGLSSFAPILVPSSKLTHSAPINGGLADMMHSTVTLSPTSFAWNLSSLQRNIGAAE